MSELQLNLVVIRSAEIERSARFYQLLGMELTRHRHGSGPEHYAWESGDTVFEIYPAKNAQESTSAARIGFRVPSVDAALAVLEASGAVIVSPAKDSPWGRRAVVSDPDGHRIELTEAK